MVLSQHGNDIIDFIYPDWINIFAVYEDLNHDGYDEDGPESNIWDLYIYYETPEGLRVIDNWHWEDWYSTIGEQGYLEADLCVTYSCEDFFSHPYFGSQIAPHLCNTGNPQDLF